VFHPAPGRGAYLVTHGAAVPTHLSWSAGGLLEFADDLLVAASGARLVDSRLTLHAMGSVGVKDLVDIGLVVPGAVAQLGQDEGAALGDVRVISKLRLFWLERKQKTLGGAVIAEVTAPSGDEDMFNGDPGPTFVPRVAIEGAWGRWGGALNVGYRLRESSGGGAREVDDELVLSLGLRAAVGLGLEVLLDGYAFMGTAVDDGFSEVAAPAEALAAVRYRLPEGLVVQLGGGLGITKGYGASGSRILASLSYEPPARQKTQTVSPREDAGEEDAEWEWELE
jgi:hypothetical protein